MDDNGKRSSYIAAQCPFDEATAMDTWRMIYQQAVPTVVVLNRVIEDGSLRCLQSVSYTHLTLPTNHRV